MAFNNDRSVTFFGDRHNSKQQILAIPCQAAADKPGILLLQDVDDSGVYGDHYLWFDSNNNLRTHTSKPTNQDSDGSAVAGGATTALDNLASVAINTSLISDTKNTDDLGSAALYWKDLYLGGDIYVQEAGVGTKDVKLAFAAPTDDYTYTFPDAGASASVMLNTGAANTVAFANGTSSIAFGANADLDIAAGVTVNVDQNLTVNTAAVTLNQSLQTTDDPTFGALTVTSITDGTATLTAGAISGLTTVATTSHVSLGADNAELRLGAGGASDSYIKFDGSTMVFYDTTTGPWTLAEIASGTGLNPLVIGDLTISDGQFNWTNATDETSATWTFANTGAGSDIDIVSVADSGEVIHIVANSLTTGQVLDIETDSVGAAGALVYLDITEGGHDATGNFIQCYNGSADVFEVGKYGAITIAGTATGTDILTAAKGDITLTEGELVLTDGVIDADTDGNFGHNFATSANAAGSATTFFTITNSDAAFDQALVHIDSNATGAYDGIDLTYEGIANALHITTGNVAGYGISFDVANSHTDPLIDMDLGPWVGTAGEGVINIASDSGAVAEAGHAIYVDLGGTTADAAAISGKGLYIKDAAATTAGSYLVHLESTNNDAIWVNTGNIVMNTSQALQCGAASEWSTYNDGSNSVTVLTTDTWRVGSAATNYTEFSATNGAITFAGAARPTQYMYFNAHDFSAVSGPVIGLVPTSGAPGWLMDGASSELLTTNGRTPTDWASGGDWTVKIYYCANDATTKDVKFDTHIHFIGDGDNVSTDALVVDTVTDTMAGAAYAMNVATITIAAGDIVADEYFTLKVERDAADAADTLDAIDLYLLGVEIAYAADHV
jgi:hypothetical protein